MTGVTRELDTSGLNCPLPILRAKKAMAELEPGEILRVIATDPESVKDFEAFARQSGNVLLESSEEGASFIYCLKKT